MEPYAPPNLRRSQKRTFWHNSPPSQEGPMRQSKFTETQIVSMLKEADAGRPVNEIWRSDGLSSATDGYVESPIRGPGGVGH